jgi:hypothetical protein
MSISRKPPRRERIPFPFKRGGRKRSSGSARHHHPVSEIVYRENWPTRVKMQFAFSSVSPIPAPSYGNTSASADLIQEFDSHVQKWKRDTRHLSSLAAMISHPSYRRIMGMGKEGLPLLFRELSKRPDHWFAALSAMTGIDPVPQDTPFGEAVKIWLAWGREKGYLNSQWSETQISKKIFLDYAAAITRPRVR